jgi:twitching motility protein PilJ
MFKNLRLRTQLAVGFGALILLLLIISGSSLFNLYRLSGTATQYLAGEAQLAEMGLRVQVLVLELRRFEKDSFLNLDNETSLSGYQVKWGAKKDDLNTLLGNLGRAAQTPEDQEAVVALKRELTAYETGLGAVVNAIRAGKFTTPQQANTALAPIKDSTVRQMEKVAEELAGRHAKVLEEAPVAFATATRTSTQLLIGLVVVAVIIGILGAIFIANTISVSITKPLFAAIGGQALASLGRTDEDELGQVQRAIGIIQSNLTETKRLKEQVEKDNAELQENIMQLLGIVADASDGNLTVRAPISAGALGNVADAFNSLLESQQKLLSQVKEQIAKTNESVERITGSARQMADDATSQARQVAGASEQVTRISAEIDQVSEIARQAAEAAKRTEASAVEGSEAVNNVITGMGALRLNVQAGAKKMKNLGDRSMEITGIVGTISRISEQTNMLALNAAIEAARAGEQGRGFSVVAEEVRKLAERTAAATREIDKLVKAIHAETAATIGAIEEQTQVVEQESHLVGQAGSTLSRIREVSSQSAGIVVDISAAARRQAEGTGSVVQTMAAIQQIARTTQQGAEGTVTNLEQLAALSEALRKQVERFKLG